MWRWREPAVSVDPLSLDRSAPIDAARFMRRVWIMPRLGGTRSRTRTRRSRTCWASRSTRVDAQFDRYPALYLRSISG
jgi:hypothetical protein